MIQPFAELHLRISGSRHSIKKLHNAFQTNNPIVNIIGFEPAYGRNINWKIDPFNSQISEDGLVLNCSYRSTWDTNTTYKAPNFDFLKEIPKKHNVSITYWALDRTHQQVAYKFEYNNEGIQVNGELLSFREGVKQMKGLPWFEFHLVQNFRKAYELNFTDKEFAEEYAKVLSTDELIFYSKMYTKYKASHQANEHDHSTKGEREFVSPTIFDVINPGSSPRQLFMRGEFFCIKNSTDEDTKGKNNFILESLLIDDGPFKFLSLFKDLILSPTTD